MKTSTIFWILGGVVLLSTLAITYETFLQNFLPSWEGFSSHPYWDNKQWSWGYGTRVPGSVNDPSVNPGGSITRAQAMIDALAHTRADYSYLKPLITRSLSPKKWAAYLSFSYNEGPYNADNLVTNINSGDDVALETQWKKYIYAGGQVSQNLIDRRSAEWNLWSS